MRASTPSTSEWTVSSFIFCLSAHCAFYETMMNTPPYARRGPDEPGFTLIELVVVIALIGIVVGVAFPQLLPLIVFSQLEGSARHVAGYGRAAMSHCSLMREPITVIVDLDEGVYWARREMTGYAASHLFDDEDEGEDGGERGDVLDLMHVRDDADEDARRQQMDRERERFDAFARIRLESSAKNVKREGILDEIGPLFDDEDFSLEYTADEEDLELYEPLLLRTTLPPDVSFDSVRIGGDDYSSGEVEIAFSPLGLSTPVVFYLTNIDDDYYTVEWDPLTFGAHLWEGRQSIGDMPGSEELS